MDLARIRLTGLAGRYDGWLGWLFIALAASDGAQAGEERVGPTLVHQTEGPYEYGTLAPATFSPDGRHVAIAHEDEAWIWHVQTGYLVRELHGHTRDVTGVQYTQDGSRLVTWAAGFDRVDDDSSFKSGEVATWDAHTGELLTVSSVFDGASAEAVSPAGDRIALLYDGFGVLTQLPSGRTRCTFPIRAGLPSAAAFSDDGEVLFIATRRLRIRDGWSCRRVRPRQTDQLHLADRPRHAADVGSLGDPLVGESLENAGTVGAVSSDGSLALAYGVEESSILDLVTGERRVTLGHMTDKVLGAAFSTDGRHLAIASEGGTLVWDLVDAGAPKSLQEAPHEIRFSSSGSIVGLVGNMVQQFSPWTGRRQGAPWTYGSRMANPFFSENAASYGRPSAMIAPDGSCVAVVDEHDRLLVHAAETGEVRWQTALPDVVLQEPATTGITVKPAITIAMASNGSRLMVGSQFGVAVWNAITGALVSSFRRPGTETLEHPALTPHGDTVTLFRCPWLEECRGLILDAETGEAQDEFGGFGQTFFGPQGHVLVGRELGDRRNGQRISSLRGPPRTVAWSPDGHWLVSTRLEEASLVDLRTGDEVVRFTGFFDGSWLVSDPDGRFETEDIGGLEGAVWTRPFDPLTPLPVASFARTHFVPGLLARSVQPDPLPTIPDVLNTNPVVPTVSLHTESTPSGIEVIARVCPTSAEVTMTRGQRRLQSGARDLRVLMDGRLVGWSDGDLGQECSEASFVVRPPSGTATVELTAYAFNTDNVKSQDAIATVPNPAVDVSAQPRAYGIHVGVDNYSAEVGVAPLRWAAADAHAMREALAHVPNHEVVSAVLADGATAAPTRANLSRILATLAGAAPPPSWAPAIEPTTPDDLVIVTFSGHGQADEGSTYRMLLADGSVSETELASWLRPIAAKDMALVIDACQAAAAVEGEGFAPGPLVAPGFGQLAYDKGMLVLAASRADEAALETDALQNGVLTWALVRDGLERGLAKLDEEPGVSVREWLRYGSTRVPELTRLAAGERVAGARLVTNQPRSGRLLLPRDPAQRPLLFDFKGHGATVLRGP